MSVDVTIDGELAFPSRFIGAADLKGKDVTLTVADVSMEDLLLKGGKKTRKVVIGFEKTPKLMVCNKTNAVTIADLLGSEMKGWIGKRITLYPTTTKMGPKTVSCVRVRETLPPAPHPGGGNQVIDPATANV